MTTLYKMALTCGCSRWYPVRIHPFNGALLHCSEHGFVHSQGEPLAETREPWEYFDGGG